MTDDMTPAPQRITRILVTACCCVLSAVAGLLIGLVAAQPQPSNNPLHDIEEVPAILGFAEVSDPIDHGDGLITRRVAIAGATVPGGSTGFQSSSFAFARDGEALTRGNQVTVNGHAIGAAHLIDDNGDGFLVVPLPDVPEPRVLIGIME